MYAALLVSFALAVSALPSNAVRRDHDGHGAVYFLTNGAQNSVAALQVGFDGRLSDGSVTATGGAGGNGINAVTGKPAGPDALFSQQPLTVAGDKLFAVNAGSNSISMFRIDPRDPTRLTLLGQPVSSGGEFPMSIAASERHHVVCVANSGAQAGIACAKYSDRGLQNVDSLRPFNLGQTTPPQGPGNTVAHTFFNADESALVTTVKGVPGSSNHGFISTFPVRGDSVSQNGFQSTPSGFTVEFGVAVVPFSNHLVVSDPSIGAGTIALDPHTGNTDVVALDNVQGQKATCWAIFAPSTGTAFLGDAGVNDLVEVDPRSGRQLRSFNSTNGNGGNFDMGVRGPFLYALSAGSGAVAVFDVAGREIEDVQNFKPAAETVNAIGIAVY